MIFFIVSRPLSETDGDALVPSLARVNIKVTRTIPVIAVTELHTPPRDEEWISHQKNLNAQVVRFRLDDFVNERQSKSSNQLSFDLNLLSNEFDAVSTDWILIDCEHSHLENSFSLIKEMGNYVFFRNHLENRNFVFLVPESHVTRCVARLNETVNNIGLGDSSRSVKIGSLIVFYKMRHLELIMPSFIHSQLRRIYHLFRYRSR